ncbi:MAG: hypothetical protein P8N47_08885, partial [Bacteroidia bacterium]|nr:hypothetical protein [Bacteroidia bacterium]
MQRSIVIFTFLVASVAYGQKQSVNALNPQEFTGRLSTYLDIITVQTDVQFSFKNKLLKKKYVSIPQTCTSLAEALAEIKSQCALE